MANQEYAQPDLLVDTGWLEEHLNDPDLRIVDCDPVEAYRRAHIKGARAIPAHHYIKHAEYPSDPKKHPLVAPPDTMKELMESMGIGDDNLVVAYDSNGSNWAARLWWALNYYGHTGVKVLDGGWKKWFDEGRPVTLDEPETRPARFTPRTNADLYCTLDYGVAHVGDPGTVFLDVRSDEEWNGTQSRGNRRRGRIPGAVHLEWKNFITADKYQTFKSAGEIDRMLREVGATPDKEVVTY